MQCDDVAAACLTVALAPTVGADAGSRAQSPDALAAYLERSLGRRSASSLSRAMPPQSSR